MELNTTEDYEKTVIARIAHCFSCLFHIVQLLTFNRPAGESPKATVSLHVFLKPVEDTNEDIPCVRIQETDTAIIMEYGLATTNLSPDNVPIIKFELKESNTIVKGDKSARNTAKEAMRWITQEKFNLPNAEKASEDQIRITRHQSRFFIATVLAMLFGQPQNVEDGEKQPLKKVMDEDKLIVDLEKEIGYSYGKAFTAAITIGHHAFFGKCITYKRTLVQPDKVMGVDTRLTLPSLSNAEMSEMQGKFNEAFIAQQKGENPKKLLIDCPIQLDGVVGKVTGYNKKSKMHSVQIGRMTEQHDLSKTPYKMIPYMYGEEITNVEKKGLPIQPNWLNVYCIADGEEYDTYYLTADVTGNAVPNKGDILHIVFMFAASGSFNIMRLCQFTGDMGYIDLRFEIEPWKCRMPFPSMVFWLNHHYGPIMGMIQHALQCKFILADFNWTREVVCGRYCLDESCLDEEGKPPKGYDFFTLNKDGREYRVIVRMDDLEDLPAEERLARITERCNAYIENLTSDM